MSVTVVAPEVATFKCSVEGFPIPTIEWRRNGTALNNGENIMISSEMPMDGSLITSTLTLSPTNTTLSGTYTCVANSSDVSSASGTLTVYGKIRLYS